MRLPREIQFGLWILILFNLLISFGAIALLERMTPAIETTLKENVYSLSAVEEMLSLLALEDRGPEAERAFQEGFANLQRNVTEAGEAEILSTIQSNLDGAIAGETMARQKVVRELRSLGELNLFAMNRADAKIKKLGRAGAWSMAVLGFFAFWGGAMVLWRFRKRVVDPLCEICTVLSSWRQGELLRRCRKMETAPELREAMENINSLLDDEIRPLILEKNRSGESSNSILQKQLVEELMERIKAPTVIIDDQGQLVSVNAAASDRFCGKDGENLRERLRASVLNPQGSDPQAKVKIGSYHIISI